MNRIELNALILQFLRTLRINGQFPELNRSIQDVLDARQPTLDVVTRLALRATNRSIDIRDRVDAIRQLGQIALEPHDQNETLSGLGSPTADKEPGDKEG